MSIANPQPDLPGAEVLVAYLDGELPPEECRRVEERLGADADYRQQLRELDRAWEALDALPATRADDDFARTTMELVTVAAEGELSQHTARAAATTRRRAWKWAAAGVAAAIVGFIAAWSLLARGDRALIADLPVIWQIDHLSHIEDFNFLQRLSATSLDELPTADAAVDEELAHLASAGDESRQARRDLVESLAPEQKVRLAAQAQRFNALSSAERQRLRQLQRDISQADNSEQLQRHLIAYGDWLAHLRPGEQEELREGLDALAADEQVGYIRRFVRREREQTSRRLSAADAEKLRQQVLAIAEERRSLFEEELRHRGRGRARRLEGSPARVALIILSWELRNDATPQRLVDALSPEARSRLGQLGPFASRMQLWRWIRDSLQPTWGPGELELFFTETLTSSQREQLLNLPPGEMQAQLERLYVGTLGFGDVETWRDEVPGRRSRELRGPGRPNFRPGLDRGGPRPPRGGIGDQPVNRRGAPPQPGLPAPNDQSKDEI